MTYSGIVIDKTYRGDFIITHEYINVYGVGNTLDAAFSDFESMLDEHYYELTQSEDTLAPGLKEQLEYIRQLEKYAVSK